MKNCLLIIFFLVFINTSTLSQLTRLKEDLMIDSLNKPDAELLEILKKDFRGDWFYAKDVLLFDRWPDGPGNSRLHINSLDLMNDLVQMRNREWKAFATQTQSGFNTFIKMKAVSGSGPVYPLEDTNNNLVIEDGAGSTSVTSDIDISLKGEHTELAVAFIDSVFKIYFKTDTEPGTLFDINVYASDWMHGDKEIRGDSTIVLYLPLSEVQLLTGKNPSGGLISKMDDQEEVWSFVHILRNITPEEWVLYTTKIQVAAGNERKSDLAAKFSKSEFEWMQFKRNIDSAFHEAMANMPVKDPYDEDALLMRVSNRLYEQKLIEVKQNRINIKKKLNVPGWSDAVEDSLILELRDDISRALTYANEVYSTEGAVLHTVKGKQGAQSKLKKLKDPNSTTISEFVSKENVQHVKYVLRKSQYIQSVNENLGDVLHSLNHYAEDPGYAAYRAGKYLNRLCEAATELLGSAVVFSLPGFQELNEIGLKSVVEKDAKKAGGDPMYVHDEKSFFVNINEGSLKEIREASIILAAGIMASYYGQQ